MHDFEIEDPHGADLVFANLKAAFEDAVVAVWTSGHSLRPLVVVLPAAVLLSFLGNLLRICVVAGATAAWPSNADLCRTIHEWSGLPIFALETLLLCRIADRAALRFLGVTTNPVDPAPSGDGAPTT